MRFTEHFELSFTQAEIDFVDIRLDTDTRLFFDPWAFASNDTPWCEECHAITSDFFQAVLDALREGDRDRARRLVSPLREDNRTRLGYSAARPCGHGLGSQCAEPLLLAIESSEAFKTGRIEDIESAALFVDKLGLDIVSDMLTNVLREKIAEYTQQQCRLYGVPLTLEDTVRAWRPLEGWVHITVALPSAHGRPLLLVPRSVVRKDLALNPDACLRYLMDEADKGDAAATTALEKMLQVPRKKKGQVHRAKLRDGLTKDQSLKSAIAKMTSADPSLLERYKRSTRRIILRPVEIEGVQRQPREIDLQAIAEETKSAAANVSDVFKLTRRAVSGLITALYPTLQHPRLLDQAIGELAPFVCSNLGDRGLFASARRRVRRKDMPNVLVLASGAPINKAMLNDVDLRELLDSTQSGLAVVIGTGIARSVYERRESLFEQGILPVSFQELSLAIEAESANEGDGAAYFESMVAA